MGEYFLGIELGSTRIKAVAIEANGEVVAKSDYAWKSKLNNGYWSYDLEDVDKGVDQVIEDLEIEKSLIKSVGISAMMHGFLAFDSEDKLLTPFRTWQNTNTTKAAEELSKTFKFNIPERWSVAHLYQAVLDQEDFVNDISYITTLAGYVHKRFTNEFVLGIGDASGMFPIDSLTKTYNKEYVELFDKLLEKNGIKKTTLELLPEIKLAGEVAGTGKIGMQFEGIEFCPPEGDAGTGMIATNSIRPKTGNVSAGTSVFAMVVLEKALRNYYSEVDIVTTPLGNDVGMVHANNCTLDVNAWVCLFSELLEKYGVEVDKNKLYEMLFNVALDGEKNGGGLINFPYLTGEQITGVETGQPAFLRELDANFSLANFMRVQLMSCLCALKIGFNLLTDKEGIEIHQLLGHGGFFNTKKVGQEIMSAATGYEVGVMETANEGGAWGMAILAAYTFLAKVSDQSLQEYLDSVIFKSTLVSSIKASTADIDGFNEYLTKFQNKLYIER